MATEQKREIPHFFASIIATFAPYDAALRAAAIPPVVETKSQETELI
jgi:hypothetical protein